MLVTFHMFSISCSELLQLGTVTPLLFRFSTGAFCDFANLLNQTLWRSDAPTQSMVRRTNKGPSPTYLSVAVPIKVKHQGPPTTARHFSTRPRGGRVRSRSLRACHS